MFEYYFYTYIIILSYQIRSIIKKFDLYHWIFFFNFVEKTVYHVYYMLVIVEVVVHVRVFYFSSKFSNSDERIIVFSYTYVLYKM